jgi:transcription-repair coupling factor (superfamily II helicase)
VAPRTERVEPGQIAVTSWPLSGGFRLPSALLVVLTENEVYGWQKLRRPKERKFRAGLSIMSLSELSVGDYVVHINSGIARYGGLVKQTVGGIERDYLLLEYAGADKLYVPVTQIDRVQKYIGPESKSPPVDSLKSDRWARRKRAVRASARLMAKELLDLYAERERAEGFAFGPDSPWLNEMENSFRYEETRDQYEAIQDVKRDMQRTRPADRLICGDVGYGKTEVAIRAAFKAVLDHKQVAVLVPTTVLAQQHWNTFRERLDPYPITVEMLSRFKTPAEQRQLVSALKQGTVDVVIGTHRLLQGDVQFKDLGLVIVDEEQRFGVRQKEKLKKLRAHVDVFTLTATPIPRTLHMSLAGIRDISIINDPPQGRIPIRTVAREYDEDVIREAIHRELERGGQVYYVHNRVQSINHVAAKVQRLAPSARIAVGHGQLAEDQLEQVMLAFFAGDFDVLVCTTIIESGLDIPNVNTIVIEDAHRFGLSQLYQLRGRVGRSSRQAYCYLMYRYPDRLTLEAEDRLQAIQEFSELGSGFKIALRDLEIRGAGDILGQEQSGHVSAVGLDMYCKLLADAVKMLRGEDVVEDEDLPALDLPVEAVIPRSYVEDEAQRISLYRRLSSVKGEEELQEFLTELRDRYGEPPQALLNLARIVQLKLACLEVGITSAQAQHGKVYVKLSRKHALTDKEQRVFHGLYRKGSLALSRARAARLPRATFQARVCSFAYTPLDPEQTFRSMDELIERLRHRDPEELRELLQRRTRGV